MELWQANPYGFLFEIPQMRRNTYAKEIHLCNTTRCMIYVLKQIDTHPRFLDFICRITAQQYNRVPAASL